jgi:hypothetical protein
MSRRVFVLFTACLLTAVAAGSVDKLPLPPENPVTTAALRSWLGDHRLSPEAYVVSKFADHDIVFLGEYHRIKHDPLLVQALIPLLYEQGVRCLGIEFACAHDQASIDGLIVADTYDEGLARRVIWNFWPFWGYKEYVDILRAAWRLNHGLSPEQPTFRIVGLNARSDWSYVLRPEDLRDSTIMSRVRPDGSSDEVMANTIGREIIDKGQKALIYSGINHAFTHFRQPIVDDSTGAVTGYGSDRMGNRIYDRIGDRCFLIFLHAPWPGLPTYSSPEVYPADGTIDALFSDMSPADRRVGFDLKGSPFGGLTGKTSLWRKEAEDFRLEMYCDGWIFQRPISQYEGVSVIDGWFTDANRLEAIAQIANPDPRVKNQERTAESLTEGLASDANMKRRFAEFR